MRCGWWFLRWSMFWAGRLAEGSEHDAERRIDEAPPDTALEHTLAADGVLLPVPTAWPMVLALGVTLMITGMVTHWVISLLGVVLAGAFRSVGGSFRCCRTSITLPVPIVPANCRVLQPANDARKTADRCKTSQADPRRDVQRHRRNQGRHRRAELPWLFPPRSSACSDITACGMP